MKIVFTLKYFLPGTTAGTEVYAAALCRELLKQNVEVLIIKPRIGHRDFNEYYYEGIRVLEYPESDFVDKDLQTGKRKPEGLHFFKDLLVAERPDAIHFHEISGSNGITIEHLRTAKELDIPVFLTLHLIGYTCQTGTLKFKDKYVCNGVVDTYKCSVCTLHKKGFRYGSGEVLSSVGQWLYDKEIDASSLPAKLSGALSYPTYTANHFSTLLEVFSISEKVFVLSEWFKQVLLVNNLPQSKMVLLPKALPGATAYDKKIYGANKEAGASVNFIYLGRVSKVKGLHTVLQALKELDKDNWTLDIYGQVQEDEYFHECDQLIKETKGAITWKGIIKPNEVVTIIQQYDALIFPTIIQEMVGLVVQEAFAAGVPVIGANVKGIEEQVTNRVDGLLFEAGNPVALKGLLEEVIGNPSLLPQLAANIKPPLLFEEVAEATVQVYKSVLQTKKVQPHKL